MEVWGDPWAEASDDRLKGTQVARERHVLENWQDDTGWKEWQDREAGSRSEQIEKGENSQPASIQIPARKHTLSDSVDSAVSFGAFPDDIPKPDFVNVLSMDTGPDSATLLSTASSGAELSSVIISKIADEDANKIRLLLGQHAIPDVSSNVEALSSDSLEASCEKDDAAEITSSGMPRNVAGSSTQDFDLVKQLFSVPRSTKPTVSTEPNAIISSISSRKVWYRITRKETLREFNMGESDVEYVRINWAKSNIRKMTLENVSEFDMDNQFNHSAVVGRSHWCGSSLASKDLSGSKIAGRNNMIEPTGEDAKISHVPCKGDIPGRRTVDNSAPVPQFSWNTLPIVGATMPAKFEARIQASCTITSIDEVSVNQSCKNTGVSTQQDLPKEAEEIPTNKYTTGIEDGDDDEWGEMVGSGYVNEKKSFINTDSWRRNVEEFVNNLPDISYIFK
jgi:hypothetical protein